MERTTVDFGIDLGTTNSSIAVLEGTNARVLKNNINQEYTPSVVWVDTKGTVNTGQQAKNRIAKGDIENAQQEFKRRMGTPHIYRFAASGRQMKPEELSAEILKSLRVNVVQRIAEEPSTAVISVPAAFELPQCKATEAAARFAGLSLSPLVQEPVAAAMAYGFQSQSDRVFWLVYDFGGGTFDAAIIHLRDGQIQVVNHGGDNMLGGTNIDWEIVEHIIAPAIQREYGLSEFTRGNPQWKVAFCKLKAEAEDAKIRLSQDSLTNFIIDDLYHDNQGKPIRFEYDLQRNEIEPLIEPLVMQSVNMCKKVLEEARLSPKDIEKLILVGGPTLTPVFRQILTDKLPIPLEFEKDPITVVAQGAAVFAGTQRIPDDITTHPVAAGQYRLELDYQPIGSDPEPLVGGKIIPPEGESMAGFTIELLEQKTQWTSGKIDVSNGAFMTNVPAEPDCRNEFLIQLQDHTGHLCQTVPDRFSYTIGTTVSEQILTHSVGLALADGTVDPFFKKGTPLPARARKFYRTTIPLKKGGSGAFLIIPAIEGENARRANRNPRIGSLEIRGDNIARDLPLGTEVEVTIEIDESRLVRSKAYVPILDEWYEEEVLQLGKPIVDPSQQPSNLDKEKTRLQQVRDKARQPEGSVAREPLERIQREDMVSKVEGRLSAATNDQDAACECEHCLLELRSAIDEAVDVLEWPSLVAEAREVIEHARQIVDEYGGPDDRTTLSSLETETEEAISANDADLLRLKMDGLYSLYMPLLAEQPGFWVSYFNHIVEMKPHWTDSASAELLLVQGRRAIEEGDLDGLRAVVRQLINLLPPDEQEEARAYGSTIMRL